MISLSVSLAVVHRMLMIIKLFLDFFFFENSRQQSCELNYYALTWCSSNGRCPSLFSVNQLITVVRESSPDNPQWKVRKFLNSRSAAIGNEKGNPADTRTKSIFMRRSIVNYEITPRTQNVDEEFYELHKKSSKSISLGSSFPLSEKFPLNAPRTKLSSTFNCLQINSKKIKFALETGGQLIGRRSFSWECQ